MRSIYALISFIRLEKEGKNDIVCRFPKEVKKDCDRLNGRF